SSPVRKSREPGEKPLHQSKPLNKVIVSFVKPTGTPEIRSEDIYSNSVSPTKEPTDSPRFEHAYIPGDVIRHLGAYHSQMTSHMTPISTCLDDDVQSERSYGENVIGYSPGVTSRTNILSHMAKHKTSWVENSIQNRVQTAQRTSPILVKGTNPNSFETPYEKSQRSKDTSTKGVRNGKRYDLLPICKYLAHFQNQIKMANKEEKRLPLVRISSVQRMPSLPSPSEHQSRLPGFYPRFYRGKTFFTERHQFKPREARSLPTRGEAAFIEIREQLPRLYRKQYNAPVVVMGREQKAITSSREKVALPVVT
ncbi:uncharacterized protein LOC116300767, partial [Actinia tenebrosa]|uniref:Uncharacterized protein LOC116300767 n=1 Tax=Actinia tenebrosa TaxID=6105 RepID=A0A6P8IFL7_ACTTE